MKKVKNLMIGTLALTTSFLLVSIIRRKNKEVRLIEEKNEELERNYIDLSEQLNKVEKENKEIKEEIEEKVYKKEYTA